MSRRANRSIALAFTVALLASGCAGGRNWPPEPARVEFGVDACVGCRMIVSDPAYSAQFHGKDGTVELFDDLGCLLQRHAGPDIDPSGVFVHAWTGDPWVRGNHGWLMHSSDLSSPMGFGFAAFPDRAGAETEMARRAGATVMPLSTLLREGLPRPAPDASASGPTSKG